MLNASPAFGAINFQIQWFTALRHQSRYKYSPGADLLTLRGRSKSQGYLLGPR